MFQTIRNAWKIPELRKRLLFTLMIIVIFRIGAAIPVPFLNVAALKELMAPLNDPTSTGAGNSLLGFLNIMSGGAFSNATIFAMSITPYINASIIIQLLTVAIPALGRMAKEGDEGRKKLGTITRYTTVGLGLLQGFAYYMYLRNTNANTSGEALSAGYIVSAPFRDGFAGVFVAITIVLIFTAGTALMMWLGEQINQFGIGNGISILLFAGIVSRLPTTLATFWTYFSMASQGGSYTKYYFLVPLVLVLFLALIWVIVFMNDAERRVPIQYAKRVVGRKMYGGQSTHMPIKVSMSGVMPIIFASSILSIPSTIKMFWTPPAESFGEKFLNALSPTGWIYSVLYFILIIAFAYFYTAIQYNPVEMANNLRKNNGAIPGIRPGKPTSDYLAKILGKITLIGALFLAVIAILPIVLASATGMNVSLGGTSVIILVGVALETMRQIESQMMMRHYKGFLDN